MPSAFPHIRPVKLGTFGGVFTPNVLTILGVVMFLRAGWVVGNAGLRDALLILCIATSITFLTSLSLSAIATNTRAKGGGAYYLISRSLGLEIGGSIGLPLYLAQAVSVAFYIAGFTESLQILFPHIDPRSISFIVLGLLFMITWMGADFAVKAQYVIMALLGISLVSFFLGYSPVSDWHANWAPAYTRQHTFWSVFAIFFPAVTGIMSGVSMSGDLKNPARSIPRGTLWSVSLTFLLYAAHMVWLALNAERAELLSNNLVMKRIAAVPPLIFLGLWAATLSSALACLVGAPRTLQALGKDRVMPHFLSCGQGIQNEPRIALALTLVVAGMSLWIGTIDLIAPVISMFFLTTYGMINLAAGLERWAANPSYRPSFRVHWTVSVAGALGCGVVMFLLNPAATLIALGVIIGVYSLLKRRHYRTAWGDMRSGFWFAMTRFGLLQLSASRQHVHNWRPVLLVLVGNPKSRLPMVEFADGLESNQGLLFLAQVITGDWQKLLPHQARFQDTLAAFIQENRLSAVAKTVITDDFEHGVTTLLQVAGLGQIQPDTVLIGWSEDAVKQKVFARTVQRVLDLKKNLLVFEEAEVSGAGLQPVIDVWWRARDNGSLMLTLAQLLQDEPRWSHHSIRIFRVIADQAGKNETQENMQKLVLDARIQAEVHIIVSRQPPLRIIARTSQGSEVCFVGIAIQSILNRESPLADYTSLINALKGNVFLTKSWRDLEL